MPFDRGSYIYLPSESNGPNLLDEPLKGFIVNPAGYQIALLFKSLEKSRMGTRLLEFGRIRLAINQLVIPVELESSPKDRSCLSAAC